jgi:hypothetical protein
MKTIKINDFPKYTTEFHNDGYDTWEESVRANGYKSVKVNAVHPFFGTVLDLSDEDYTWFLLRWS